MAIALTKYVYPLENSILLSQSLGYTLDNPRSEEEIKLISDFIAKSLENYKPSKDYNPIFSLTYSISELRKALEGDVEHEYAFNFYKENYETKTLDVIAKSWIIIRYEDDGLFEKVQEDDEILFDLLLDQSNKENSFIESFFELSKYCYSLSLISITENEFIGESLLFLENPQTILYKIESYKLIRFLEKVSFAYASMRKGKIKYKPSWLNWPLNKDRLLIQSELLDSVLAINEKANVSRKKRKASQNLSPKDKLLFVGDILRMVNEDTRDIKVKLLLLVSIVEFMLTRNPDFNRFNVEDSISKQFKLKTAILVYQHDKSQDLAIIQKHLGNFYSQRSNIAHGNFIAKKEESEYLNSVYILYSYIKAIIVEYLKDSNYVDYLKDN